MACQMVLAPHHQPVKEKAHRKRASFRGLTHPALKLNSNSNLPSPASMAWLRLRLFALQPVAGRYTSSSRTR